MPSIKQKALILRDCGFNKQSRYPKYYTKIEIEYNQNMFMKKLEKKLQDDNYINQINDQYQEYLMKKNQNLFGITGQQEQNNILQKKIKKYKKHGKKPNQNPDPNKYFFCQYCQNFLSLSNRARHNQNYGHPKYIRVIEGIQTECAYVGCNEMITQQNIKRHNKLIHNDVDGPFKLKINKLSKSDQSLINKMPLNSKVLFTLLRFYFKQTQRKFIKYSTITKLIKYMKYQIDSLPLSTPFQIKQSLNYLIDYSFVQRRFNVFNLKLNEQDVYIELTFDDIFYKVYCLGIRNYMPQFIAHNNMKDIYARQESYVNAKMNHRMNMKRIKNNKREVKKTLVRIKKQKKLKRMQVLNHWRSLNLRIYRKPKKVSKYINSVQDLLSRPDIETRSDKVIKQAQKRQQWMEYVAKYPYIQKYQCAANQFKYRFQQKLQTQDIKRQIRELKPNLQPENQLNLKLTKEEKNFKKQ